MDVCERGNAKFFLIYFNVYLRIMNDSDDETEDKRCIASLKELFRSRNKLIGWFSFYRISGEIRKSLINKFIVKSVVKQRNFS